MEPGMGEEKIRMAAIDSLTSPGRATWEIEMGRCPMTIIDIKDLSTSSKQILRKVAYDVRT
jgi:hypothetical protein